MTFHPDQLRIPDRQRSGAHRPHRSPLLEVVPAVLVLLAVLGVGVGVWQLDRSTASTVAASGGPADNAGAGEDSTASPSPTSGGSPTATASTTATASGTATQSAAPTSGVVDRAVALSVLNATNRGGLAGRAARALRATGWSVTTGNERGQQPPTTVFYAASEQQATAQAVADDLGGSPAVQQSSQYGSDRITVVLGDDYNG